MTLSTQTLLYSTPRPRKRGAPPIPVIQRLPVNLWKDIMYLLLRDDTSALAACALVHSTWRVFVQALLFKHRPLWLGRPCPEKRNHQLEVPYRFLHSSCSNPVEPGESRISAFVSTFARNLRLAGHVVEVHYDLFLATRHLWLLRGPDIRGNLALDDFPDLPALLDPLVDAKLPNLSALRLTNLYRQGLCREYGNVLARSKYPYLTKMTGTDTALGRHFPALVRLELVDLLLGNLQTLENLLCSLPSLEHVLVSGLSFGTQDPLPDADSPRSVRLRTLVIRHVAHSSIDPIIPLVEWLGKTPTAATLEHLELDGIVSEELVTPFAHFETEEPNHDLALTLRLERSFWQIDFGDHSRVTTLTIDASQTPSEDLAQVYAILGMEASAPGEPHPLTALVLRDLRIRFPQNTPESVFQPRSRTLFEVNSNALPALSGVSVEIDGVEGEFRYIQISPGFFELAT